MVGDLHELLGGDLEEHREAWTLIPLGVLDAERDERLASHVGGEGDGPEVQDGSPPLEDGADSADSHVPVLVRRSLQNFTRSPQPPS